MIKLEFYIENFPRCARPFLKKFIRIVDYNTVIHIKLHVSRRMQNEAVAPTIPFTIVHGNTELCCVIKHCLKITNVKIQMRKNAYV